MSRTDFLRSVLRRADDPDFVALDARFAGPNTLRLCVQATGETGDGDELAATALIDLDLRDLTHTTLRQVDFEGLAYVSAHGQDLMLLSGGTVHHRAGKAFKLHQAASASFLHRLAPAGDVFVAFGDDGEMYALTGGRFHRVPTGTTETLMDAHFLTGDRGLAVGSYGTVLKGGLSGFAPWALAGDPFADPAGDDLRYPVTACRLLADGTALIGSEEGPAVVVRGEDVQVLEGLAEGTTIHGITEFRGRDFWGDDQVGVLTREGGRLVIVAGAMVYAANGTEWVQVELVADPDAPFTRCPLDFVPRF